MMCSCCGNEDCGGSELYLTLRFEDSNGNNMITEGLLTSDSIRFVNIYENSREVTSPEEADNEGNIYLNILYATDSVKIKVGEKIVGIYDIQLVDYDDSGCCDGFRNFSVSDNLGETCMKCNGVPVTIKL